MHTVQTTARTPHERLRVIAMINAAIAAAMGLSMPDMRHILAECDHPIGAPPRQPKGFWRVDKDKPPEQRQTVLTLLAFEALHQHSSGDPIRGMASFLTERTDGWLLPETARLADHGMEHDDHRHHLQPVASRIGPRLYDWQLAQLGDEAMRARCIHARNLLGELDYARLMREQPDTPRANDILHQVAEERAEYEVGQLDDQPDIFN